MVDELVPRAAEAARRPDVAVARRARDVLACGLRDLVDRHPLVREVILHLDRLVLREVVRRPDRRVRDLRLVALHVRVDEQRGGLGELVPVRRLGPRLRVDRANPIGAQRIHHDEQHVLRRDAVTGRDRLALRGELRVREPRGRARRVVEIDARGLVRERREIDRRRCAGKLARDHLAVFARRGDRDRARGVGNICFEPRVGRDRDEPRHPAGFRNDERARAAVVERRIGLALRADLERRELEPLAEDRERVLAFVQLIGRHREAQIVDQPLVACALRSLLSLTLTLTAPSSFANTRMRSVPDLACVARQRHEHRRFLAGHPRDLGVAFEVWRSSHARLPPLAIWLPNRVYFAKPAEPPTTSKPPPRRRWADSRLSTSEYTTCSPACAAFGGAGGAGATATRGGGGSRRPNARSKASPCSCRRRKAHGGYSTNHGVTAHRART